MSILHNANCLGTAGNSRPLVRESEVRCIPPSTMCMIFEATSVTQWGVSKFVRFSQWRQTDFPMTLLFPLLTQVLRHLRTVPDSPFNRSWSNFGVQPCARVSEDSIAGSSWTSKQRTSTQRSNDNCSGQPFKVLVTLPQVDQTNLLHARNSGPALAHPTFL
jgi:hypothetical protein